jgi:hypothetical protein
MLFSGSNHQIYGIGQQQQCRSQASSFWSRVINLRSWQQRFGDILYTKFPSSHNTSGDKVKQSDYLMIWIGKYNVPAWIPHVRMAVEADSSTQLMVGFKSCCILGSACWPRRPFSLLCIFYNHPFCMNAHQCTFSPAALVSPTGHR